MLPPGHIAAGFLLTNGILWLQKGRFSSEQEVLLTFLGMFFAFAPDLDEFYFFYRNKNLLVSPGSSTNHRNFVSHAPWLWFTVSVLVYVFSGDEFYRAVGLLLWVCSWSHFFLDSFGYGIMWLWPFSKKLFGFSRSGEILVVKETGFFSHTFAFLKVYSRTFTFYLEIFIVFIALILLTLT